MEGKFLTQISYIKMLMEENRLGEANNMLSNLSGEIQKTCETKAREMSNKDLRVSRNVLSTKRNNSVYLDGTWYKLLGIKGDEMELEVTKGINVKTKFKVEENHD